jgi:hypothetical protein
MANLLDDIGTYLVAQSVGTLQTDMFLGWMPDTPDACVAVMEGIGDEALETFGSTSATNIERPGLQILCRGAKDDYDAPRIKAEAAKDALQDVTNQSLSGTLYQRISMRQPPSMIGRDENGRILISVNFNVHKDPN